MPEAVLIPEMLTLREAAARTRLPYEFLRQCCLRRKIRFIRTGTKYLINLSSLAEYLAQGDSEPERSDL